MKENNNNLVQQTTIEQELDAVYNTTAQTITMVDTLSRTLEERLAGGAVE